jgi:hypothetical protein
LRADGIVPVLPAPGGDPLKGTAKAVLGCLALDDLFAGARFAPEMGKTQEIECPGTPCRTTLRRGWTPVWTAELDQPGLFGMQRQPVLLESLREYGHQSARILFSRKQKHSIVRTADEMCFARQTVAWPHECAGGALCFVKKMSKRR